MLPHHPVLHPAQRLEFLKQAGWSDATQTPIAEDWSQRKIFRVATGKHTAILMHAVPDDDPRATPGHKLRDYFDVSLYLRKIGLSAPVIYAHDLNNGLLLVEDFGEEDFPKVIARGSVWEQDMYRLATNVVRHLYDHTESVDMALPDYYAEHIHKGRRRVVDWYMPSVLERKNADGLVDDYLAVWDAIEKKLPAVKRRMVHGDFHPANLIWLPQRDGLLQVGLLDFQGALMGPAPYDLVNLLDDARRIVPADIRRDCLKLVTQDMQHDEREAYLAWYNVLSAQFHCRVIGQALRLAIKDGKERLLAVIPILRHHLQRDLSSPVLSPLKSWFAGQGIDFTEQSPIDLKKVATFIRDDAF